MLDRIVRLLEGALAAALLTGLCLLSASADAAHALNAEAPPSGPLGYYADFLQESGVRLTPDEVMTRLRRGEGATPRRPVPDFGIGARPVWLHWRIENHAAQALIRRLSMDTPWVDDLDVYVIQAGTVQAHWQTGDARPQRQRPIAGLGFAFDLHLEPGRTDVLMRAATADPMVLPTSLQAIETAGTAHRWTHYSHGFVYGYLLALIAYNLLLYTGLRKRSHLLYAVYLAAFILMNLGYTGHGYAWLWPDYPGVQRYVILISMVLFGVAGLQFAARFLDLARHAPALRNAVHLLCVAAMLAVGAAAAAGQQAITAWIAFGFVVMFALVMLLLGVLAVRHSYTAARYFLAAAVAGMSGTLASSLAVWGFIPFNEWTYRAVELGMLADATLLALAIAHRFRQDQQERIRAEHLARTDPLTRLPNRRAFREQAEAIWSTALRRERDITLVMIDIDHFKQLNDRYGHQRGDEALAAVGQILLAAGRRGDVAARWGGEEFVLLLPETNETQAAALAERLRQKIALIRLRAGDTEISLSASFGVAQRRGEASLDALIDNADRLLYRAKQLGRDRVVANSSEPAQPLVGPTA
ncbi:diguanylate cyclase [Niveibacterium microcysteis]|uniref:diguanylate cyclase n=1 Tax=Niveibacterium microcysteis TaxID=2811415 RepID=A0ABX7M7Y9_9RHOO|nr:diguanylate cyclase [Niveibacterium microcysteis]QSI77862.1 GGDEF domain-containing protein [Niveibacterium microcysteis]